MKALLKAIDATSEWTGKVVGFFVYAGIAVLVWEVMMRYLFHAPTIWAHGTSMRIFAVYYILSGAYVLLYRGHVNMDAIYNRLSLRTKAITDVITASFLFALCGVLLWKGAGFAWISIGFLETDQTPFRAPMYPIKVLIPLGAFLLLLQGLAKFTRDIITAITGRHYEY